MIVSNNIELQPGLSKDEFQHATNDATTFIKPHWDGSDLIP